MRALIDRLTRRLNLTPHQTFLALMGVLLVVVVALLAITGDVYESISEGDGIGGIDRPLLDAIVPLRTPAMTTVMVVITEISGRIGQPLIILLAAGLLVWRRRNWTAPILVACAMLGSVLLTVTGKNFTDRVRPPRDLALPPFETSPSFPSGHTMNATVLTVTIAYLVVITAHSRWARWLAISLAVLAPVVVAASRVYLGQHWLTDVVAGFLLGLAWAGSVIGAHRVRTYRRRRQAAEFEAAGVATARMQDPEEIAPTVS